MSGGTSNPHQPGLIGGAQETLKHCKRRWDKFREHSALTLDNYIDESVTYAEDVLDDSSGPREWVKGGVALWVEGYSATRSLWTSAYRLLFPGDGED